MSLSILNLMNIYHLNLKKMVSVSKDLKGNALNEIEEIKKNDGTPFKVFTPYWKTAEKIFRKNTFKRKK